MRRLEVVGFDLWETLLTNPEGASSRQDARRIQALRDVLLVADPSFGVERVEQAYSALWARCHELYWANDLDIPTRRQIEHLLESMELDHRTLDEKLLAELEKAYADTLLHHPPEVVPHAVEVLRELRGEGLRIGLISNTGRTPGRILRQVLERSGLAESIDVMLFSDEEQVCKPRPSIFQTLLRRFQVEGVNAAFVGDNLEADVHGSQQCGMFGIHFMPEKKGSAVAPATGRGGNIAANLTVRSLDEIPPALRALRR